MNTETEWKVGDVARTSWEPSGLVRILDIEPAERGFDACAFIEFVEDHPMGYEKGSPGRYYLKELRKAEADREGTRATWRQGNGNVRLHKS